MWEVVASPDFDAWFSALRDRRARAQITRRLRHITLGHLGDSKFVGEGISELRINSGPGYRVYYTLRSQVLVILLCGGDKSSQSRDIRRAQQIASAL